MANFLLIWDSDRSRRESSARKAQQEVAFLPRLHSGIALATHYALVWASAPHAPVGQSRSSTSQGSDCLLFGEPHDASGQFVTGDDLRQRHDADWTRPNQLNGFYSALGIHPERGVRAEADVLGVFPLYYWQGHTVVLIGTSPALFRCHPLFHGEMDPHGVAAILLTSGSVGGRTLWRGVRRLPPDHILFCAPGGHVREVAPAPSTPLPMLDKVDDAVAEASALHTSFLKSSLHASRRPGLQLSGGLDSRLLAGFTSSLGLQPTCLTFGRKADLDARCAIQVAEELGLPQTLSDVVPADYRQFALASVEQEGLSGGLYALPMGWNIAVRPPPLEMDRMVCGLTLDAVIGGPKQVARAGEALSFEGLRVSRLGLERSRLDSVLATPELKRACDDVRDELVQTYLASGETDHLREWRMNLQHRHRFAVGACAWRYALFAWPVMPALDRKLIQLAIRLPYAVVKDRQIQTRMLITRFPRLARLELDRNYLDTTPLAGTQRTLAFDLKRRLVKLKRRTQARLGTDPRFYVRTMEFNSPGWRVARSLAADARTAAHSIFNASELNRLLPPPDSKVRNLRDPIIDSAPLKNVLGLVLWAGQHGGSAV
jgi:asparagine synthase (glutamine-hydrolysing)